MATWAELVAFIRAEYEVIGDEPDEIRILVRYLTDDGDDRSGALRSWLWRGSYWTGEDWVQIASPFARVHELNPRAVLAEVGNSTVVGGVAIVGEFVVLRHSLPLVNLDINEFVDPLVLVTDSAEMLERQFIGRDDF